MISLNDIKKREIAILGTGLDAVKCVYKLHNEGIGVKCFLNNNSKSDMFLGCPVYEPVSGYRKWGKKIYVIIAVGMVSTYVSLSKQLTELGLEEFTDYIYYKWLDRKLVLLHGNCHMEVVKAYLESSDKFLNKYAIYPNYRL